MKYTAVLASTAVVLWWSAVATSQTKPDFAGQWSSAPEPTAAVARGRGRGRSGDMGSGWGTTITVGQDARQLTVEYAFFSRGDLQPPLRFAYALDGSESINSVMMGRGIQVEKSRARWDGDTLVIVTTHATENPETGQPMTSEVTRTLSIESAESLIVEATRSSVMGGPASTTRTVYRKR